MLDPEVRERKLVEVSEDNCASQIAFMKDGGRGRYSGLRKGCLDCSANCWFLSLGSSGGGLPNITSEGVNPSLMKSSGLKAIQREGGLSTLPDSN